MDHDEILNKYANSLPTGVLKFGSTRIRFAFPNRTAYWRVSSFETKEPETVKWISGFQRDDVFVDIGANMGLYSLFAQVFSGARVFAFEPESQNYALLNTNIRLNGLSQSVVAWCCALTDGRCVDRLYMTNLDTAGSGHEFGAEVDTNLKPIKAAFTQGSLGYSLDDLVSINALPVPNHIKIDVDGIEHLVVRGARDTLSRPEVESVLIEISPHIEEHSKLIDEMAALGFHFDPAQVERARREEGPTKDYAEYIFRR